MSILGIDVGGANLKYATLAGAALSRAFPLWQHPTELTSALNADLRRMLDSSTRTLAVTMTGELADCYADRAVGVQHIVTSVCEAAEQCDLRDVRFYGVDGRFRCRESAIGAADLVAASNWHALASFVAREICDHGTLIDIGSTTTDLIPLLDGRVATAARSDFDRLREGSLVYVGCQRTPVCSLVDSLQFQGDCVRVMNEVFATIDDAHLILGATVEDVSDCDTADGQPRTRFHAANRMARMVGLDHRSCSPADAVELASQVMAAARVRIEQGLHSVDAGGAIVFSGHGDGLWELPPGRRAIRLADSVGDQVARAAPSFAVASLCCQYAAMGG